MDEIIRRGINAAEEQEFFNSQNIYEGITVRGRQYQFEARTFFAGRLSIHIPTCFFMMPAAAARVKYPSGERPQIIMTNDTGSVNITLSLAANSMTDAHIPEVRDGMKNLLKRLNPTILFLAEGLDALRVNTANSEEGRDSIGSKTVGYFEFKAPALGEPLFNLMFVTAENGSALLGSFNCPYADHKAWRPVARQIMQSLRLISEPGEDPHRNSVAGGH
jgi:hypothetical protein